MQDPPASSELLGAVADFLRGDAAAALSGRAAFLARVSANVLDIVAREITLGTPAAADERFRLHRLLADTGLADAPDATLQTLNTALCEAIRDGRLGARDPALVEHLWRTTLDKVAIDQPAYASYKAELGLGTGAGPIQPRQAPGDS